MPSFKPSDQPVVYSNVIQAVLAFLVTSGWLTIDSVEINSLATCFGVVIATTVGYVAHQHAKPVATPSAVAMMTKQPVSLSTFVGPVPPSIVGSSDVQINSLATSPFGEPPQGHKE